MQYGPGGASDRTNASTVEATRIQSAGVEGLRGAQAGLAKAGRGMSEFQLEQAEKVGPDALAQAKSIYGLNTAVNQRELLEEQDKSYNALKARTKTMPEYDTPYTRTTPETRGRSILQKFWQGDLFNTNPMMGETHRLEEERRKRIAEMNRPYNY
jgi:hypothetical protein